ALEGGDEQDKAARGLLAERGLTPAVVDEARGLLTQIGADEEDSAAFEPNDEELAAADKALWAWYLEWSAVARTVIRDRRTLISLGFLRVSRQGVIEVDDGDADDQPTAPPAVSPAGPPTGGTSGTGTGSNA